MKKALFIRVRVPFLLLLFIGLRSFAGHNRSGYISYTHTSGNTYHFKIITYTDPTDALADRCFEIIVFTNLDLGTTDTLNCSRTNTTSGIELENLNPPLAGCNSGYALGEGLVLIYPDTLSCPANYYGGVKFNIYEGNYTFSNTGRYVFGIIDPNLDNGVNNIPNSSNVAFALVDTLNTNNYSTYNNSPFTSNALIDSACAGQAFHYNPGMVDTTDNDSLSYTLIPFITGVVWTTNFSYVSGYVTPSNLTVDAITGELSWLNTPNTYGEYDVDILMKEYRRVSGVMVEIASEIFAVQIYVKCCSASGIEQIANRNEQVTIYPNPSNGSFVIETTLTAKQTLQVYDVSGKLVLNQAVNGRTNVDASSLNEGVYNITIIGNSSLVNKKLVIVR